MVGPPLPRLLASNVACMRGNEVIFRNMNFVVYEMGALLLTGPNGSGKSTMLRMLAGFLKPTAGHLLWEGNDLTDRDVYRFYKVNVHFLGSKDAIKSELTIDENVRLWAELEGTSGRVSSALERVGLKDYANDPSSILSLGQRRRVQLARLVAIPRKIWLLDEPSVGLDVEGVDLLETLIAEHRRKGGLAIVATHTPIFMENSLELKFPPRSVEDRRFKLKLLNLSI